jgi:hypothetical protein
MKGEGVKKLEKFRTYFVHAPMGLRLPSAQRTASQQFFKKSCWKPLPNSTNSVLPNLTKHLHSFDIDKEWIQEHRVTNVQSKMSMFPLEVPSFFLEACLRSISYRLSHERVRSVNSLKTRNGGRADEKARKIAYENTLKNKVCLIMPAFTVLGKKYNLKLIIEIIWKSFHQWYDIDSIGIGGENVFVICNENLERGGVIKIPFQRFPKLIRK